MFAPVYFQIISFLPIHNYILLLLSFHYLINGGILGSPFGEREREEEGKRGRGKRGRGIERAREREGEGKRERERY